LTPRITPFHDPVPGFELFCDGRRMEFDICAWGNWRPSVQLIDSRRSYGVLLYFVCGSRQPQVMNRPDEVSVRFFRPGLWYRVVMLLPAPTLAHEVRYSVTVTAPDGTATTVSGLAFLQKMRDYTKLLFSAYNQSQQTGCCWLDRIRVEALR